MKKLLFSALLLIASLSASAQSKVYQTREISPEALIKIYKALGVKAEGRVAVKISTGEGTNPNYLKPTLIRNLVDEVNGTIVENRTAYPGDRMETTDHCKQHGTHTIDWAEKIGLGSKKYEIVNIDR